MQLVVHFKLFHYLLFFGFIVNILFFSTVSAVENDIEFLSVEKAIESHEFDAAAERALRSEKHYLHTLIQKALALELESHPVWRTLLHYKKSIIYGSLSQVDGADYFNSKDGKTNAKAELVATLASFFSTEKIDGIGMTPRCRFPARYYWLDQKLAFSMTKLKKQNCEKFGYFSQALDADGLTIVFPSSHPNSPSSMFGHTLLRFDRKGQTRKTRMLAYTANYAAEDTASNELAYAFRGLTGGFIGKFSIIPYYMKLREYSQMENRDIWEYSLNLSTADVDFIVMHAFELQITHFDYYFFTENCSYHLLSLIEVAMPELKLTDYFQGPVIPINTIKLLDKLNLIAKKSYFPSNRLAINSRRKLMSDDKYSLAIQISNNLNDLNSNKLQKYSPSDKAEILDLAYDLNRFNKIRSTGELATKISHSQRKLLIARSALKVKSPPAKAAEFDVTPDAGHETSRMTVGAGVYNSSEYAVLGYRLAYHDILDPFDGYSPNSQIQFLNIKLRYHPDTESYQLGRLDVIDILSLEPRDDFFRDISWRINTGVFSLEPKSSPNNMIYTLNGGPGVTYQLDGLKNGYAYSFFESAANYSQVYRRNIQFSSGLSIGVLANISRAWKIHVATNFLGYINNRNADKPYTYTFSMGQSYRVAKNIALNLQMSRNRNYIGKRDNIELGVNYYF